MRYGTRLRLTALRLGSSLCSFGGVRSMLLSAASRALSASALDSLSGAFFGAVFFFAIGSGYHASPTRRQATAGSTCRSRWPRSRPNPVGKAKQTHNTEHSKTRARLLRPAAGPTLDREHSCLGGGTRRFGSRSSQLFTGCPDSRRTPGLAAAYVKCIMSRAPRFLYSILDTSGARV